MAIYKIKGGNDELLKIAEMHRDDLILVDFHAEWCGPCKKLAPVLHDMVKQYAGHARKLVLCTVDVEDQEDLATDYNVNAMPTLVWISKGSIVHRIEGYRPDEIQRFTATKL